MKKIIGPFAAVCLAALAITSCQKNTNEVTAPNEISQSTLAQMQKMGFSTEDVKKVSNGYLVEGDIFLTDKDLGSQSTSPNLIIAQEEQYQTFNTVDYVKHKTINVALDNKNATVDAAFSAALDETIRRYNAEGLSITFARVAPTQSPDITILAYYEKSNTLGFSGFPSNGDPYNQVQMNTYWYNSSTAATNTNYIATIMAHEIGHCIGFRHTDYMDRSFSCGGRKQNEEKPFASGYGAVYIPGTATGPDKASWMLACIGDQVNRPFNANDIKALNFLY